MSAPLCAARRRTLAAAMDRVLPGGEAFPGAAGAHAVGFAEWLAREGELAPAAPVLAAGLALLDALAAALAGREFAACAPEERDEVLRRVRATPHPTVQRFFVMLVRMTLTGCFGPPEYGGNRGGAGWEAAGFHPRPPTAGAGPGRS